MNTNDVTNFQDDPKFTAMALNELSDAEAEEFKSTLIQAGLTEEEIQEQVEKVQQLSQALKEEFNKDETVRASQETRSMIMQPLEKKTSFTKWLMGTLAGGSVAVIALLMVQRTAVQKITSVQEQVFDKTTAYIEEKEAEEIDSGQIRRDQNEKKVVSKAKAEAKKMPRSKVTNVAIGNRIATEGLPTGSAGAPQVKGLGYSQLADSDSFSAPMLRKRGIVPPPFPPSQPYSNDEANREAYDKIDTNPYTLVSNEPLSTFSVDVDTASYANMRRFLLKGQLPPKDSIRVEELINYFHYENKFEFNNHPVAINVQQANSIWNKGRKIVKVALKADCPSNLTQAKKNLVFLMDVSGSMGEPKKLPLLKDSMKLLLRKLKATDTISLVVYAGAAGVVLEPTEAKESVKILRALDNLNAGGSTNGGAGIIAAYKMAKQGFIKDGVNRVILATDGDFNVGTSSQSELIDLIENKAKEDIFLTVVGLGMGNYQDSLLEKISNRGNGNYAYIDSLSEANKLFNIDLEKNLTTVAKDVKIQIEFNPNLVQAYRLIGYENRMLAAKDFNDDKKDAGEMGAGHTVTALYEVVPVGEKFEEGAKVDDLKYAKKAKATNNKEELLTVKVRYKQPTGTKSTKFEIPLKNQEQEFKAMDSDFKFATAVASFGMKLRNDKLVQDLRYRDIENMAKEAKGSDQYDFRTEFLELIDLAKQIDK